MELDPRLFALLAGGVTLWGVKMITSQGNETSRRGVRPPPNVPVEPSSDVGLDGLEKAANKGSDLLRNLKEDLEQTGLWPWW